ncbi:radical SAM protein [Kordiimonas sp. SCSIO 12603]|uniref:radical SAM/SPASM domain-containing protein n=1 Tax=Kordiimonas sp. SCSIO 12603 TaxID=2829596 RepID=UPI0021036FEB|nr:radical SAM protein [Kordiimonas sp. SCSIO 12603]UTW58839.1 radical SAM protein [Kordiimonas sp. SCSIO 12603]
MYDQNYSKGKLFVVLKVAEVCNLKCKYCYFFFAGDESYKKDPSYIAMSTVRDVAKYLAQAAKDYDLEQIDISLHGGEPLMIGKKRFEEICQILNEYISPLCALELAVQTNAVLIDEGWIDLFSIYDVGVGISLDGPRDINDIYRIDKKNKGTYDAVVKGLNYITEARKSGKLPGAGGLVVINPESDGGEIYKHMVHDLGFKSLDFLAPQQSWVDFDLERTQKVAEFYSQAMSQWLEDDNGDVNIRAFSEPLAAMLSNDGARYRVRALKDVKDAITIRSNGDVCPDDALTPLSENYRYTGFNVSSSKLRDFREHEVWADLAKGVSDAPVECKECKWLGICRGGLAEHRYSVDRKFSSPTTYCSARKDTFERLYEYVTHVIDVEEVDQRLTMSVSI